MTIIITGSGDFVKWRASALLFPSGPSAAGMKRFSNERSPSDPDQRKETDRIPGPFAAKRSGVSAPVLSVPSEPAAFQRKTFWESTPPQPLLPSTGRPEKNPPGRRKRKPLPEWLQATLKSAVFSLEKAPADTESRRPKEGTASTPKAVRYIWAEPVWGDAGAFFHTLLSLPFPKGEPRVVPKGPEAGRRKEETLSKSGRFLFLGWQEIIITNRNSKVKFVFIVFII